MEIKGGCDRAQDEEGGRGMGTGVRGFVGMRAHLLVWMCGLQVRFCIFLMRQKVQRESAAKSLKVKSHLLCLPQVPGTPLECTLLLLVMVEAGRTVKSRSWSKLITRQSTRLQPQLGNKQAHLLTG